MFLKSSRSRSGFTLVEIMIVVAIIALLAAIAIPGFLRARKRSQASRILNDLRSISSAVDQYAIENSLRGADRVEVAAWTAYIKPGSVLFKTGANPVYGDYGAQTVDLPPAVPANAYQDLSDVAPETFWAPYYR